MAGSPNGHFTRPGGPNMKPGAVKGTVFVSSAVATAHNTTVQKLQAARKAGKLSDEELMLLVHASPQPAGQFTRTASPLGAETTATGADPNVRYTLRHKLVDLADLTVSNTGTGAVNPAYPHELQPRDRSRDASQAQIATIAAKLNPDALITDIGRIDAGSPVVDHQGNVLSGNGRTLALHAATPEKLAAYRDRLRAQAEALGIDPAALDGMKHPVLVRELAPGTDRVAFAQAANSSGVLRMSPLEQAAVDGKTLPDTAVLKLHIGEGSLDQALRSKANEPFIDDFLAMVPQNEKANLVTRHGTLNQLGLYRAKAALFSKAFPGEAGSRLAESMLESLDPDLKQVQTGIASALPAISRASALIRRGERAAHLSLTEDLAKAVDMLARIRDNPALTADTPMHKVVAKYLSQSQMFDKELSHDQERLLVHIDSIAKKPTEVKALFTRWAKLVEDAPAVGQATAFGVGTMSKSDLIDALIGPAAPAAAQGGLF